MKKLIYISHWRFPSEKTMSPLIMKSCEEFSKQGFDVELWIPRRSNGAFRSTDPFTYHHVEKKFVIKRLPVIDFMNIVPGALSFQLMVWTFNISVALYAIFRNLTKKATFYVHDFRDVMFLLVYKPKLFLEVHDFYKSNVSWLNHFAYKKITGFIVTNKIKIEVLKKEFGIPENNILHEPNAVDTKQFNISLTQAEARQKLGLPADKKIVMYTGHLFDWKGVYTLAEARVFLNPAYELYFVGGTVTDRDALLKFTLEKKLHGITFVEHQDHSRMPLYCKAANVLVLPNTAKMDVSKYETSPVKLFEYMASCTPIVASDLPSIRNVVDEKAVTFFTPDDPKSLARSLEHVINDRHSSDKAVFAKQEVEQYTWDKRFSRVHAFIEKDFTK